MTNEPRSTYGALDLAHRVGGDVGLLIGHQGAGQREKPRHLALGNGDGLDFGRRVVLLVSGCRPRPPCTPLRRCSLRCAVSATMAKVRLVDGSRTHAVPPSDACASRCSRSVPLEACGPTGRIVWAIARRTSVVTRPRQRRRPRTSDACPRITSAGVSPSRSAATQPVARRLNVATAQHGGITGRRSRRAARLKSLERLAMLLPPRARAPLASKAPFPRRRPEHAPARRRSPAFRRRSWRDKSRTSRSSLSGTG